MKFFTPRGEFHHGTQVVDISLQDRQIFSLLSSGLQIKVSFYL